VRSPSPGGQSSSTAPSLRPHQAQDRDNTARLDTEAHFRTDASYLPDLHTYLDDLLRVRERLRAAVDVDDWARAEATPSDEEITRIRRLINRISGDLDALTPGERAQADQAVATVRRRRGTMLGLPKVRQPLPDIRPERPA
jgi:hypothetical protein